MNKYGFTPINATGDPQELIYDAPWNLTFKTPQNLAKWAMSSKNAVNNALHEFKEFARQNGLIEYNGKSNSYMADCIINPRQVDFSMIDKYGKGVSIVISKNYSGLGVVPGHAFSEDFAEKLIEFLNSK